MPVTKTLDVIARNKSATRPRNRRGEAPLVKTSTANASTGAPAPPKHLPRMIPLPDVRQATGYTCGTASLMSILSYFGWIGDDPNEKDFAKELGTTWKNGTEPEQIVEAARKLGVSAVSKNHMTLDEVWLHVKRGEPVMVAYQAYRESNARPWSEHWNDGHWSIVIGMDRDNVYLEDPSMLGKRGFIPRKEFEERWRDTDEKNRHVYEGLGIVFRANVKKEDLNEVDVKRVAYVP
jgi:predicted double-glycine peptidase